jgi:hypothetical protein
MLSTTTIAEGRQSANESNDKLTLTGHVIVGFFGILEIRVGRTVFAILFWPACAKHSFQGITKKDFLIPAKRHDFKNAPNPNKRWSQARFFHKNPSKIKIVSNLR